jgi:hypothetical protein
VYTPTVTNTAAIRNVEVRYGKVNIVRIVTIENSRGKRSAVSEQFRQHNTSL